MRYLKAKLVDYSPAIFVVLFWALLSGLVLSCVATADGAEPVNPYPAVAQLNLNGVQGSGTLIAVRGNTGLVLSCRHVNRTVGAPVTLWWGAAGRQATRGVVIEVVPGETFNTDIAFILCERPKYVKPVKLAIFDRVEGPWVSVGWRDKSMRLSVANQAAREGNVITTNAPFIQGMSGGPTFDRYGRQVAIVVASDLRTIGVSCDGPLLHAVLKKYRRAR